MPDSTTLVQHQQFIKVIADLLRTIREEADYSQEDVYALSTIHVARIENGSKDITLKTLKDLCDLYGLSLNDFFARLSGFDVLTKEAS